MEVEVRVPLHVTGFWRPVYRENPLYTGSIGSGVNIHPKLVVRAKAFNKKAFYLNNKAVEVDSVNYVLAKTPCNVLVNAYTSAPLGAGYGLSGGLALGTSIAASIICREEITLENAAAKAHIADVVAKTGLGDVIAEYYGGLEIRVKPGAPGIGSIVKIPVDPSIRVVTIVLGLGSTPSMLSRYPADLSRLAESFVDRILSKPSLETFIELSQIFTRKFFDYTMVDKLVAPVKNMVLGYYVKKGVAVFFVDRDRASDLIEYFRKNSLTVIHGRIDYSGVEIVDTPRSS